MVAFTWQEINALKLFAAEGGRIVFVGEWDMYYGVGIGVENQFLSDMGAEMVNIGQAVECGYRDLPGNVLRQHQVTNNMTAVRLACASVIVPGPNDFALIYDSSETKVLAGVAKIDVTPLPPPATSPVLDLRFLRQAEDRQSELEGITLTASGEELVQERTVRRR